MRAQAIDHDLLNPSAVQYGVGVQGEVSKRTGNSAKDVSILRLKNLGNNNIR